MAQHAPRIAGISTAIALKKQLNFENFVVSVQEKRGILYLSRIRCEDIRERFGYWRNMEGES